jgi:hypothetical protein
VTKGKAIFGLMVVFAGAVGAIASGLFGKPEEVAKRFLPAPWYGADRSAIQGPQPETD